jgi:hypothetical protein
MKRTRKHSGAIVKRTRKRSKVPVKVAGGPTIEEISRILHDLNTIRDQHPDLYFRIYELLGWLLLADGFIWQQQENREWMRHQVARHHLERGRAWDTGGDGGSDGEDSSSDSNTGAFQSSADDLRGHPATASPYRIEAAYKTGERKLPPELRRVPAERRRGRKA